MPIEPTPSPVGRTVDDLPEEYGELYEERAAIREFDGGQPCQDAERDALDEVFNRVVIESAMAQPERHAAFLPGNRWSAADEAACTARCKRCRQPIIWGQCDTDSRKGSPDVGRWFPLDPDMGTHGCAANGLASPGTARDTRHGQATQVDRRK